MFQLLRGTWSKRADYSWSRVKSLERQRAWHCILGNRHFNKSASLGLDCLITGTAKVRVRKAIHEQGEYWRHVPEEATVCAAVEPWYSSGKPPQSTARWKSMVINQPVTLGKRTSMHSVMPVEVTTDTTFLGFFLCSGYICGVLFFSNGLRWFNPSRQRSTTQPLAHSPPAGQGRTI